MTSPARLAALRVLRDVHSGRRDLPSSQARARISLADPRDRALSTEIVLGTLRWRAQLDYTIQAASSRPLHRVDADVLDLLRLSAYQLLHLERVPPRAVVDDAVSLTRTLGKKGKHSAAGYVNAVLRAVARRGDSHSLPQPSPTRGSADVTSRESDLEYLSVTMSHPRWLVERWYDRHGFESTERWTQFNNTSAPVTLRVNTLVTTAAAVLDQLRSHGVEVETARWAPNALVITRGGTVAEEIDAGNRFWAQDEASQLVAGLVTASPGNRVLDTCASPGGKSLIIAGGMADRGLLVSADRSQTRIRLLSETLARVGTTCTKVVRLDARLPPFGDTFDWVVLDAPCSGLGTLRRDPDIRWRRQLGDLTRMATLQAELLSGASAGVAPGGHLLYCTCSSEPEENQEVVESFLESHPGFSVTAPAAPHISSLVGDDGYLQTRPDRDGLEGFFAAIVRRDMP